VGSNTKNYRQSARSNNASAQASAYSQINRSGVWNKIFSKFKLKKGEIK